MGTRILKKIQQVPFVDLKIQNLQIKKNLTHIIREVVDSAIFIKGRYLEKFEQDFAEYIGVKYCIGVASGTDALYLSLLALGIKKGDEVIVPVNTFVATVYAILYVGAKPVLVDIDPDTYNIDTSLIEKNITKNTRAIISVHLYGQPADITKISKLAKKYNLFIVEDACQSHGALYGNKHTGNLGHLAAFSFYPSKNLGAFGDGGAITTNSLKLATTLKHLREYGAIDKYRYSIIGHNSRLDALQAAILTVKLEHLDKWNNQRRVLSEYYNNRFRKELPFIFIPQSSKDISSVYHLYVIRVKEREKLIKYLVDKGIQTGIHYPIPLHLQKSLSFLGYKKGDFPVAELSCQEILSLPLFPGLTQAQQNYVIDSVKLFYKI